MAASLRDCSRLIERGIWPMWFWVSDELDSYLAGHPYFGAITGRVAGRITGARFDSRRKDLRIGPKRSSQSSPWRR